MSIKMMTLNIMVAMKMIRVSKKMMVSLATFVRLVCHGGPAAKRWFDACSKVINVRQLDIG